MARVPLPFPLYRAFTDGTGGGVTLKPLMRISATFLAVSLCLGITGPSGFSQPLEHRLGMSMPYFVMPHTRPLALPTPDKAEVTRVNVTIDVIEQVATTTLDIFLTSASSRRVEATMIVPVPEGAALRGFTFQGSAPEPKAELLPKDEARRLYDSIVARTKDPALLEFIGYNLIRSSVFPVEPSSGQHVRLVYEHLLSADGDRVDYVLPRTESVDYRVPWKISVSIKSKTPIATIYSPSHRLETTRPNDHSVTARLAADATTEPGSFRLSYLRQRDAMTASLLAYPDPKVGGGYFLLLAGSPVKAPSVQTQKREVILVLDRSGSMAGEKLEQVRAAALQVLEGLEDGEAFNVIVYHESVESFAPAPVIKSPETLRAARAYLKGIRVRGGTNIHDALLEALRLKPTHGMLPIVLFLTDGLPTVGQTSEVAIRNVASKANPHERRIFTFGVGVDVNTPLLDRLARETRATSTYVLPKEDVEVKVGQVFQRLIGPVLAGPALRILNAHGQPALRRVHELTPARLPDLFEGDQLVLLGQYVGDEPLTFVLDGTFFGQPKSFRFRFDLDQATTKNAFVPRLWASRQIANLTDAIRDLGADATATSAANNPRLKELVDEIVRLSKEFGILTEYTAFLAQEGTDLNEPTHVAMEAQKQYQERALKVRSGYGSVNQSLNNLAQREQTSLKLRNDYWDANMQRVSICTVQQINDRAFYKRGNRWIDSSLLDQPNLTPTKVVRIGSAEFLDLTQQLASESRQGCVALQGEILLRVKGQTILVR